MPHPYVAHTAMGLCVIPGFIGLNSLFRPEATLESVKFPVPKDPEGRHMSRVLMRLHGTRGIAISYLMFMLWRTGDERTLALGMVAPMGMAFADGLISRAAIGGGEWTHWGVLPVLAGLSAALMGWVSI